GMSLPNKQIWTRVNSGASSGTAARIVTAAILIPGVVALVWWGSTALVAALGGLFALLALREFVSLGARLNLLAYRWWTSLCALWIFFQQWSVSAAQSYQVGRNLRLTQAPALVPELPLELVFFVFLLGCAATVFALRRPLTDSLADIGIC